MPSLVRNDDGTWSFTFAETLPDNSAQFYRLQLPDFEYPTPSKWRLMTPTAHTSASSEAAEFKWEKIEPAFYAPITFPMGEPVEMQILDESEFLEERSDDMSEQSLSVSAPTQFPPPLDDLQVIKFPTRRGLADLGVRNDLYQNNPNLVRFRDYYGSRWRNGRETAFNNILKTYIGFEAPIPSDLNVDMDCLFSGVEPESHSFLRRAFGEDKATVMYDLTRNLDWLSHTEIPSTSYRAYLELFKIGGSFLRLYNFVGNDVGAARLAQDIVNAPTPTIAEARKLNYLSTTALFVPVAEEVWALVPFESSPNAAYAVERVMAWLTELSLFYGYGYRMSSLEFKPSSSALSKAMKTWSPGEVYIFGAPRTTFDHAYIEYHVDPALQEPPLSYIFD